MDVGRAMRAIVTTSRTCVVAVTSSTSAVALTDPRSVGAETILIKPVPVEVLLEAVGRCFGTDDLLPLPAAQASGPYPGPI
jgi:CheY-like chemotaxis protein